MEFLIEEVRIVERHFEDNSGSIERIMGFVNEDLKHEVVTLTINLIGSGDTRQFTNEMLLFEVLQRLKVIHSSKK
jgi:hypothetical protein